MKNNTLNFGTVQHISFLAKKLNDEITDEAYDEVKVLVGIFGSIEYYNIWNLDCKGNTQKFVLEYLQQKELDILTNYFQKDWEKTQENINTEQEFVTIPKSELERYVGIILNLKKEAMALHESVQSKIHQLLENEVFGAEETQTVKVLEELKKENKVVGYKIDHIADHTKEFKYMVINGKD
jgi:tetrahydrodipicolinate N-succinyltransferase